MIRAIIFDLGGVVVPFDFRRGYAAMEQLCPIPAAEIPKRIRATGLVPLYETGKIATDRFVAELCRALELNIAPEEFGAMWSAIFLEGSLIPDELFTRLKARYPLIALSNTNDLHFRMVREKYPQIRHFDHLVLSHETGFAKPDRRIYEIAVEKTGCAASECLFIDDVEAFVEGGRAAGLEVVRFEGFERLVGELVARGILD